MMIRFKNEKNNPKEIAFKVEKLGELIKEKKLKITLLLMRRLFISW